MSIKLKVILYIEEVINKISILCLGSFFCKISGESVSLRLPLSNSVDTTIIFIKGCWEEGRRGKKKRLANR